MTAFLYMPVTRRAQPARRIDLADFGSLFADAEEATSPRQANTQKRRIAAAGLILLFAAADTILIACPDAVAACLLRARTTLSAATI